MSTAVKPPCKVATTANITLSGEQTINGVAVTSGNRVLVREQTDAAENGIYVVSTGSWSRAKDFNATGDFVQGTLVYCWDGTVGWHYITTEDPEIGSAINFGFETWSPAEEEREFSSAGSGTAGAEGLAYVYAVGDSDGAGTADATVLPAALFESSGTSTGAAVGASTVSATFSSAGAATGDAVSQGGDHVYLFADEISSSGSGDEYYNLTTDTVQTITALSVPSYGTAAAATDTTAARVHGFSSSGTQAKKYTYATQATSNSSNLMRNVFDRAAAQSQTVGYWFGGFDTTQRAYVDKITWATEVYAAGTSLGTARGSKPGAASNASRAIIAGGTNTSSAYLLTTEKYTFSGDVVAAGTSLAGAERAFMAAAGDTTRAIFAGGQTYFSTNLAVTDKYTYSGDSVVAGTSLSAEEAFHGGAGNNTKGLFAGGSVTTGNTERYVYSSDAVTAGTALAFARSNPAAACSNPGGF